MSCDATRLLVIRHGETAWNLQSRIQGHTDIPLNERGQWQAQRLAQALAAQGLEAVYSSDLQRAMSTALPLAQAAGLSVQPETGLRERGFGRFEGLTRAEVAAQWPQEGRRWNERDPSYGPQGGEVLEAFHARCMATAARLAQQHSGQLIALITHGGVLDCLYRAATAQSLREPRTWQIGNASVNRLLHHGQGLRLLAWGDTSHLDGETLDERSDGRVMPR